MGVKIVRRGVILFFVVMMLVSSGCLEQVKTRKVQTLYICPTGEKVSDRDLCPKATTAPLTTTPSPNTSEPPTTTPPTEAPKPKIQTFNMGETIPSLSVDEFYDSLSVGLSTDDYTVHGKIKEVLQIPSYTIVSITNGEQELWVALEKAEVPEGVDIIVTGLLMVDFQSPSLGRTFDFMLFAESASSYEGP